MVSGLYLNPKKGEKVRGPGGSQPRNYVEKFRVDTPVTPILQRRVQAHRLSKQLALGPHSYKVTELGSIPRLSGSESILLCKVFI